jgi:hypothetical protein
MLGLADERAHQQKTETVKDLTRINGRSAG